MKRIEVDGIRVPQFDELDIDLPGDGVKTWGFSRAMVSTCEPLFDSDEDNHGVESCLRRAKVIRVNNQTDTESCQLHVYFSKFDGAFKFIKRLNAFLVERAHLVASSRRWG